MGSTAPIVTHYALTRALPTRVSRATAGFWGSERK